MSDEDFPASLFDDQFDTRDADIQDLSDTLDTLIDALDEVRADPADVARARGLAGVIRGALAELGDVIERYGAA